MKRGAILASAVWLFIPFQAMTDEPTVPYGEASILAGQRLYGIHCPACHGRDGRARIDFVSDATDLTTPSRYRNGAPQLQLDDAFGLLNLKPPPIILSEKSS